MFLNRSIIYLFIVFLSFSGISCKKLVQVDPPVTNSTDKTAFQSNATAAAVLTGVYVRMIQSDVGLSSGAKSISQVCGLSADELKNHSTDPYYTQFYSNGVSSLRAPFWSECYEYIYTANAALEGLSATNGVSSVLKEQLMGEAYFLRSFFYFYLVNLFGDVPLHTVTDYKMTSKASRTPTNKVYQQIINDLKEAQKLLPEDYRTADNNITTERVRPNKAAATALLSRVYLYQRQFADAEAQASAVLENVATFALEQDLDKVFLKESREAIWQLQPVIPQTNTFDARYFVLNALPGLVQPTTISQQLLSSFEPGDLRKSKWVGIYTDNGADYFYPFKYKVADYGQPLTEYVMALRLAEVQLIRAESRAQLGNIAGAQMDLNAIRGRAGLMAVETQDKVQLLSAIEDERQVELFTEWGHRWLDLKRTGHADSVMGIVTPLKGGTWNANWKLFPIPIAEIQNNPNIKQNQGY